MLKKKFGYGMLACVLTSLVALQACNLSLGFGIVSIDISFDEDNASRSVSPRTVLPVIEPAEYRISFTGDSATTDIITDYTSDIEKILRPGEWTIQVEALNADIARVTHSEIEKYRREVKILAVKAAKEKAGYLLDAIGESVGKPLMIQERETYDDIMPVANYRMKTMAVMEDSQMAEEVLPELTFQKIKLKYSVFARFEIK